MAKVRIDGIGWLDWVVTPHPDRDMYERFENGKFQYDTNLALILTLDEPIPLEVPCMSGDIPCETSELKPLLPPVLFSALWELARIWETSIYVTGPKKDHELKQLDLITEQARTGRISDYQQFLEDLSSLLSEFVKSYPQ